MHGCGKCMKLGGLLLLIVGLLFLLQDMQVWNFWNLQWYTVAFILFGLMKLGCSCCKECRKD